MIIEKLIDLLNGVGEFYSPTLDISEVNKDIVLKIKVNKEELIKTIKSQQQKGLEKYNETIDDCPYDKYDWNNEALQEISDYLKETIKDYFKLNNENITDHFADTRDTLCYATYDNQTAVDGMLNTAADFAIVIGGYNSSNTSHLVELCEAKIPTYFIDSADRIINDSEIHHCNWKTKEEMISYNFLPINTPINILITSGASCPDALVEQVIQKIISLKKTSKSLDELMIELEMN